MMAFRSRHTKTISVRGSPCRAAGAPAIGHSGGDVLGYSQFIGADEVGTLHALSGHRRDLIDPTIASHRGLIVKTTGDGMLVEFASAVDAVRCAVFLYSIDV